MPPQLKWLKECQTHSLSMRHPAFFPTAQLMFSLSSSSSYCLPGVQVPPFCNNLRCPGSPSAFLQTLIKLCLALSKNLPYLLCHNHFFTGTSPLKALHMHGNTFSPTAISSKLSTSTSNLQSEPSTLLLLKLKTFWERQSTSPASQAGRTKEIIQWDRRRMKIVFLISFTANLQYVFHITYF